MSLRKLIRLAALMFLACCFVCATPVAAQKKNKACGKLPEILPAGKESKEQNAAKAAEKHLKSPISGSVAIEVNEDGDVVDAKPVHPSSGDVADYLVSVGKSMKFKPRPGCGQFKMTVSFQLGD